MKLNVVLYFASKYMQIGQVEKEQLQELLDRQHQVEGELAAVEIRIEQKQCQYLSGIWTGGNYPSLGWQNRLSLAPTKKPIEVSPKDRKFSLSSVFSKASAQLLRTQDRRLATGNRTTFQKKKKQKRGRARNRLLRKKSHGYGHGPNNGRK